MTRLISALAFGLGVSGAALYPRQSSGCCFQINVSGGPASGPLGQLDDGQNRVGPGYTAATYCLNGGIITDSQNRGCILTAPTTQFQCDSGATGTSGFTIGAGGVISYNGDTTFYECEVSTGVYNIYTTPSGTNCSPITLTTAGGACAASSSTTPVAPSTTPAPVSYSTIVTTQTVTGPTTTQTVTGPTTTQTVTGPTTTQTVTGPTTTQTVTGPTTTQTVTGPTTTQTVTGPTVTLPAQTVTQTGPTVVSTVVSTVTGPTVVSTVSGVCTPSTVVSTVLSTVTAPGSGSTVTETITAPGSGSTITETVTAPCATSVPATSVPATSVPATSVPATSVPATSVPATSVPATSVPATSVPATSVPATSVPATSVPATSVPATSVPATSVPATSVPATSVPATSVPATSVPGTSTSTIISTIGITSTVTAPPTSTASACAVDTIPSGNFQYPHLIVPVSSAQPNTAYGTQYSGTIDSTTSTIFNFDIPASYAGETCTLAFLLPLQSQLITSSYTLSGSGGIEVLQLSSPATQSTTYNTVPSVSANLGTFPITAGSSTIIVTSACAAGQTLSYELVATGTLGLTYFQDYNPSAIGLYITEC